MAALQIGKVAGGTSVVGFWGLGTKGGRPMRRAFYLHCDRAINRYMRAHGSLWLDLLDLFDAIAAVLPCSCRFNLL